MSCGAVAIYYVTGIIKFPFVRRRLSNNVRAKWGQREEVEEQLKLKNTLESFNKAPCVQKFEGARRGLDSILINSDKTARSSRIALI